MERASYARIAELFVYPREGFVDRTRGAAARFAVCPEAAQAAGRFFEAVSGCGVDRLQEIYTRSFEVQAATTLDIGYALFGDDYKRGALLANLSRECAQAGVDCGTELPDHLPNLLRLLAKVRDEALAKDLVGDLLIPALQAMLREFDPERAQARQRIYKKHYKTLIDAPAEGECYRHALEALLILLAGEFGAAEAAAAPGDFLRFVATEMHIEKAKG